MEKCPTCGHEIEGKYVIDFASTRGIVVESLRAHLKEFNKDMTKRIDAMEEAASAESLMQLKRNLLMNWVSEFPLTAKFCLFCVYHSSGHDGMAPHCRECGYNKVHGKCGATPEPTDTRQVDSWSKINNQKNSLRDIINEEYLSRNGAEFK